ncbi:MAG: acyltransferase [Bacteroidaceae bacterium]|nr:acyltransferase [Bacteroidaceae bacterium]MEA5099652.1 acyltransferase [Bacteroidales bacterium]
MKEKLKETIEKYPKLKKFILDLWVHPYSARTRWWARCFVYPFIIKRGKGSYISNKARLDLNFNNLLKVGERTVIDDYAIVNNGMGDVIIGNDSVITSRVIVVGPVKIGNKVVLGGFVTGLSHNYESIELSIKDQGVSLNTTIIEDDVWIGGNTVIVPGIKIGTHSLIGAGSVVTKDVEPYTIVAGNPAKPIKKYDFDSKTWIKI